MTELPVPPPTPGTQPVVGPDFEPTLPRHREEPRRAQADRESGETRHSDGARTARTDAVARDFAAGTAAGLHGDEPVRPGVVTEIAQMSRANLALALRGHAPERAAAVSEVATARDALPPVEMAALRAEAAHDRLHDQRPDEPVTGRRLTHPAVPLALLVVLAYLETQLTAPGVRAALETDTQTAMLVGGAIALLLTAAAELAGVGVALLAIGSARALRISLAVLGVATLGCAAWAVVDLAAGREDNLAYRERLREEARPSAVAGRGFGSARPGAASPGAAGGFGAQPGATGGGGFGGRRATQAGKEDGPNIGFVVPVTLAALLAAMTLSLRATAAHPLRQWERDLARLARRRNDAQSELGDARRRLTDASRRLDASDLHVAAIAERETATRDMLLARFLAEYARACHKRGVTPASLDVPDFGDAQTAALALLDPRRAISTQPVVVPTVVAGNGAAPQDAAPPAPDAPLAPVPDPAPAGDPLAPQPEPAPAPAPPFAVTDAEAGGAGASPAPPQAESIPTSPPGWSFLEITDDDEPIDKEPE